VHACGRRPRALLLGRPNRRLVERL
jgi:hypothetical protein